MLRKAVSEVMLTFLLMSILSLAFNIQPAESNWTGTVYIRADGSIDPPDAPIITYDNITYTLTDNITSSGDGIVVGRDNIVINGDGHTLQGTGESPEKGVDLFDRSNVTIKNTTITTFYYGIWLNGSSNGIISGNNITNNGDGIRLHDSSNNTIVGNNITANNYDGIRLVSSSNNTISGNNITNNLDGIWLHDSSNNTIVGNNIANYRVGILLLLSSHNTVSGNNITINYCGILLGASNNTISGNNIANNGYGIWLQASSNNTISGNNIANNGYGIELEDSSNNGIYHNNFINNSQQVHDNAWDYEGVSPSINVWDNGYPSGGNYWSDYTGIDIYSGPYQNQTGSDGIGDIPYIIDENNTDRYPLMTKYWKTSFIGSDGYPIVDFAVYNGKLYAAADNVLYAFNGSNWSIIDAPAFILSLEPYKNVLVVGGEGGLYLFNGTDFTLVFTVSTYIKPLGVYNNTLYAGTVLDNPPTLYYCADSPENPDNWHVDASFSILMNFSGPFGSIDSFAVYNNEMHVTSGGTVYCYNGTNWTITKTYDDVYAYLDMEVYNGKLYLATRDQAWRKPVYQGGTGFSGRVIEFDGDNWITVFDHDYWIYSLETYDSKLYVGTANKILTYDGTDWEVSFGTPKGAYYVISMITYDGKIYAGMGNGYIFEDPSFGTMEPERMTVPEFPLFFALPLFMIITLMVAIVYRKKTAKSQKLQQSHRD